MWLSRSELSIFQELAHLGLKPSFEIGSRVGRGFADLGFEEYCVLPGSRLQSLLTGTISPLVEAEKAKFFGILAVDEMLTELTRIGFDVYSLGSPDQRAWILEMSNQSGSKFEVRGASVLEACCQALKAALTGDYEEKFRNRS